MKTLILLNVFLFSFSLTFAQKKPPTAEEIQALIQRAKQQFDSLNKARQGKDFAKNGNSNPQQNTSTPAASLPSDASSFDISKMKVPARNDKLLGMIPQKPLDSNALTSFAKNLKKQIIPELKRMFNTPDINTEGLSAAECDKSAIAFWYVKHPDIALIYSISALEKDAGDPVIGNNTGSMLTLCGFDPQA